jgi:hypothetical protein
VLLVGVVALVVGFATLRYFGGEDGGTSATPAETGIAGSWGGEAIRANAKRDETPVRLELDDDGTGTMTRGSCAGTLAPLRAGLEMAVFDYTETSGERGCPRRTRVTVELEDASTLRFEERRRGGLPVASGTLQRG